MHIPRERARSQKAMRSVRARVGRVASFLHFLCEPSGHASTVSGCATGSNPRNPQSQSCGLRGARTRTVRYDARSAAEKGRKVLGRSRWDCGLRRCEARRWASGIRTLADTRRSPDGTGDRGAPSRRTVGARACAPGSSEDAGDGNGHADVRRRCSRRGPCPRRHAEQRITRWTLTCARCSASWG